MPTFKGSVPMESDAAAANAYLHKRINEMPFPKLFVFHIHTKKDLIKALNVTQQAQPLGHHLELDDFNLNEDGLIMKVIVPTRAALNWLIPSLAQEQLITLSEGKDHQMIPGIGIIDDLDVIDRGDNKKILASLSADGTSTKDETDLDAKIGKALKELCKSS